MKADKAERDRLKQEKTKQSSSTKLAPSLNEKVLLKNILEGQNPSFSSANDPQSSLDAGSLSARKH